jgi:hypothetical protein
MMAMWSQISSVERLSSVEGSGKASSKEGMDATGVSDKTAAVGLRAGVALGMMTSRERGRLTGDDQGGCNGVHSGHWTDDD